jgi:hypothetical protein
VYETAKMGQELQDSSARPVNLGCGGRFRPGWLNLDLGPSSSEVVKWDLRRGLPVEPGTTPFVYSSHMLEHVTPSDAESILRDVFGVLRPGGIVRIVVPDLASLARLYLEAFEKSPQHGNELEWARIQLFDQMVRSENGGRMLAFLREASPDDLKHAADRLGSEAENALTATAQRPRGFSRWVSSFARPRPFARASERLRYFAARGVMTALLGRRGSEAFAHGWFATTGERHLWMYDAHNLSDLLVRTGFMRMVQQSATTSLWQPWSTQNLDIEDDGRECKPHSLYMEAVKP